jgi:inosine-uridine nucleoside N-ribohydrolase
VTGRRPLIMDVDTGIDDALAILYALGSPVFDLIGITTCFGNGSLEVVTRNTLTVLEWVDAPVPVYRGADRPLTGTVQDAAAFHGRNGLGDAPITPPRRTPAPETALEFLWETFRRRPGEITLVTTARLTNLALLLLAEPRVRDWLGPVVIMGGAFRVPGNVTPVAEANIWGDPEAARHVLRAGLTPVMVGLDVTHQVHVTDEDVQQLDPGLPYAPLLAQAMNFYLAAYNPGASPGRRAAPLHDPLAVAVAEAPDLVGVEAWPVDVETTGELTRGMTVVDRREPPGGEPTAKVATAVDAVRFLREFRRRLHMP